MTYEQRSERISSARSTKRCRAATRIGSTACARSCARSAIRIDAYPTIHVGGTSGKGSTSTMIATVLAASGKRAGLHTKPHLELDDRTRAHRRRARSPNDRFGELLGEMMPAIDATTRELGRPSYYETLLALAFVHFARERRRRRRHRSRYRRHARRHERHRARGLVITNVGLDHTEILGDTLEAIARDKAGIAKRGVPLVSDARGGPREVIERACAGAGAPFVSVVERATLARTTERTVRPVLRRRDRARARTPSRCRSSDASSSATPRPPSSRSSCFGPNCDRRTPTSSAASRGSSSRGGWNSFPDIRAVIFDVAHNPDKARSLADALRETFPDRRFTFVVGISESKDAPACCGRSSSCRPRSSSPRSTRRAGAPSARSGSRTSRSAPARVARIIGDPSKRSPSREGSADGPHVVVVTGSTFVAAILRDWWLEHVGERSRR